MFLACERAKMCDFCSHGFEVCFLTATHINPPIVVDVVFSSEVNPNTDDAVNGAKSKMYFLKKESQYHSLLKSNNKKYWW